MDLKQLQYFITIVEEGTISSAAKKLHMSQPPLSYQLKQLEDELDIILVERGARQITLTEAGTLLYDRAKAILQLSNTTIQELDDFKYEEKGTIHIGTTSTTTIFLMNEVYDIFEKQLPQVSYQLHERNTFDLIELLRTNVIQAAFIRTPYRANNLKSIEILNEPFVALAHQDYFDTNQPILLEELKDLPLIIYSRYHNFLNHAFYPNQLLESKKIQPKILCENAFTTSLWAIRKKGIAIVPKTALAYLNEPYSYREIKDKNLYTSIHFVWKENQYHSTLLKSFIKIIQKKYK